MIGPFERWDDLAIATRCVGPQQMPAADALAREVAAALGSHGLRRQRDELLGQYLVVPKYNAQGRICGRGTLGRSRLYSLITPDEALAGVRAHIARISKHGPGRVWFLLDPAHLVTDDGITCGAKREGDPTEYLVQRTYYAHEAQIQWEAP